MPEILCIEDILQNAIDYIGNKPEEYHATRHDLQNLSSSDNFFEYIKGHYAYDEPEELSESQEACADYVWRYYQQWNS